MSNGGPLGHAPLIADRRSPAHGRAAPRRPGFFRAFLRLAGPYWKSDRKWLIRGLTLLLVIMTVAQVYVSVRVNEWTADLFNALEARSMDRFLVQIGLLGVIILGNMTVVVLHLRIKRWLQADWRRWLTERLQGDWMTVGRHYQVAHIPGEHDNPDGRIAEDARIATEYAIELAHSFFFCLLLLISFTNILWSLSGPLTVALRDIDFTIPGYMVWIALAYSLTATILALWLGKPLVRATDQRQTVEANFRFGLVRARENSEAIALLRGEPDERRRFNELFQNILDAWRAQTNALTRIFLFTSGYSVLSTAFPVMVAAPRYIAGAITLGALVQSAQAFQQMASALSWPVDNLAAVATWRASVERVLGLVEALEDLEEDVALAGPNTILVEETEQPDLVFHDISIAEPDGTVIVGNLDARICPGERVLVTGDPAAAAKIFKVVAGLWPWGRGRIERPHGASMFVMPQRPYLPIGTLRSAVSYPATAEGFSEKAVIWALKAVGLEALIPRLDDAEPWEQILGPEQQQRLGFARLMLHRPNWILLQGATEFLDPQSEEAIMRLVAGECSQAAILTVSHRPALAALHQREMNLQRSTDGTVLMKESRLRRDAARSSWQDLGWRRRLIKRLRRNGNGNGNGSSSDDSF